MQICIRYRRHTNFGSRYIKNGDNTHAPHAPMRYSHVNLYRVLPSYSSHHHTLTHRSHTHIDRTHDSCTDITTSPNTHHSRTHITHTHTHTTAVSVVHSTLTSYHSHICIQLYTNHELTSPICAQECIRIGI